MSIPRHHSEWLSLIEVSGPFLSIPVLMRVFPQGLENHDPEKFRTLRMAYEEWEANNEAGSRSNPAIHGAWIKFVLSNLLGLPDDAILEQQSIPQSLQANVPEHGEFLRPSHVIQDQGTHKPLLLIQVYPPSQDLDKPVVGHTWKASPGTRMMELLHATGVRLGLVTNGERWMLVDAPKNETTGFASWYASIWLEEPITLRAFIGLLGAERFFNVAAADTLEAMLAESASNQQEVTDQLGYQVRRAVEVLIQSLDRADQDHDRSLLASVPETVLYEAALTVMMRLVFLFSAEERGLLLLNDELYARNYAVSTLREQLRKTADDHGEEILERRHDAWCRLLSTFRAVFGGVKHDRLTLPAYGGHLFDPDRFPFLEGRKPGTTWKTCEADPLPVNNRTVLHLLEALQLLEVKMPGGEKAARRVSFRALDIEQIGHVYEGLLDHTAKRATETMLGLIGTRDREPEVPLSQLEELKAKGEDKLIEFLREVTGRSANALRNALADQIDLLGTNRFQAVCGSDQALLKRIAPFAGLVRDDTFGYPVGITKGSVFVTAGTDRRSSGTHYTPRSLTEPIVQYTLEPLVYVGPAEGKPKEQWQLRPAKELLDLKICDMACGSGAFLVQACRYLSERLVEAWELAEKNHPSPNPGKLPFPTIMAEGKPASGEPGEALIPKDAAERLAYARRIIAQRCLYGVDINPLAVEMAKLSLWLLTLAKDKPFTFLDHAIRCGDSLLGINALSQLKTFSLDGKGQQYIFGEVPLDKLVDDAIEIRSKIESMPSNNVEEVNAQAGLMAECEKHVEFLKFAADMLLVAELKGATPRERLEQRDHAAVQIGHYLRSDNHVAFRDIATKQLNRRSFHWPLEFPEIINRRDGFDAFIGNPPFFAGTKLEPLLGKAWRSFVVKYLANDVTGVRGAADLAAYFFLRVQQLLRGAGQFGLIATKTIAEGDTCEVGLKQLVQGGMTITRAISSSPWPGAATLEVALVWASKSPWAGELICDGEPVTLISPQLAVGSDGPINVFRLSQNLAYGFEGVKILGIGFVLTQDHATRLIESDQRNKDVIHPYLNGMDLNSRWDCSPTRMVIDFKDYPLSRESAPEGYVGPVAADYPACLEIVEQLVKPERMKHEPTNAWRSDVRARWWQFAASRPKLHDAIRGRKHVFVRSRVSNLNAIAVVPTDWVFSDLIVVFSVNGMENFGILQSTIHTVWLEQLSSSMRTDVRYTPSTCLHTFPFPLFSSGIASTATRYEAHRATLMRETQVGLTETYGRFHDSSDLDPKMRKLRDCHLEMDRLVADAYGWDDLDLAHGFYETKQGTRFTISESTRREVLARLLKLNHDRYAEEAARGLHDSKKTRKKASSDRQAEVAGSLFKSGD